MKVSPCDFAILPRQCLWRVDFNAIDHAEISYALLKKWKDHLSFSDKVTDLSKTK